VIVEDDDGGDKFYDSRIIRKLDSGSYTIEATTYSSGRAGNFDLTIFAIPSDECTVSGINIGETIPGSWSNTCESTNMPDGRYARHYTFTLSSSTNVQIDLESSSVDTYLFLLNETGTDGDVVIEDDDGGDKFYDSRITRRLDAGTYTIEATTYSSDRAGDFRLTIQ